MIDPSVATTTTINSIKLADSARNRSLRRVARAKFKSCSTIEIHAKTIKQSKHPARPSYYDR